MTTRWALLVGGTGAGKSSVATRVAAELALRGRVVGGVVQEATEEDGAHTGHRARRVGGEGSVVLARRSAPPPGARAEALREFCSFVFDDDAFGRARGWIEEASQQADVVVIDEVSKLETARAGHHDAIRDALAGRALVLLVARADQLFGIVERFGLDAEPVATLDADDEAAFAAFVEALADATRRQEDR